MHIKKGDVVRVITGREEDKGREGKVLQVLPDRQRVVVEGIKRVHKHTKEQPGQGRSGKTGGIIHTEAPIHVSNVALVVEHEGQRVTTRVGYERREVTKTRADGSEYTTTRSVRIAKKTGKEI